MASFSSGQQLLQVMPSQKISSKEKDKKWGEQCVSAVAFMGNNRYINGRTSWKRKQVNYDLVNSIFDTDDINYVLDPYGMGGPNKGENQPARMRDINIIVNKINLLKGEEMARPFNFQAVATNGDAVSAKENKVRALLKDIAMRQLAEALGKTLEPTIDPDTGEEMPVTFEEVEKYKNYSMKDIREKWANDILTYLKYKETLEVKFNNGWEHALITAEEIYYIGIVNGEPKLRVCNPLNCEFDRNPDNANIEDGDWFREDRWMTSGQILDEYGSILDDKQLDLLAKGGVKQGLANQMFPGYAYSAGDIKQYENGTFASRGRASNVHYLVKHVVWKSWKKIGFVTYLDELGQEQENIVDESFKITPEMKAEGMSVEWQWIPDLWHGTMIGADMIVGVEVLPNQIRSMDNPHEVKMPYVGSVYNGTNSVQTSVVDLIKPHQYLYNIIWYRLEAEIAKAKGKKFIMDVAAIPKSHGIDMDKWINFFDNVGIAFINSHEEGTGSASGKVSQFSQYQAVDMTISQSVGQYINILSKIESLVDRMVGIGANREGGSTAHETAHGVTTSQTQSSYITEPLFYRHNDIKRRVLTALVETAKIAYPSSKKIHYITDDMMRISHDIDMDMFSGSDYDIFLSNSSRDNQIMLKLDSLAEAALATGKVNLSDVVKIYRSNSSHGIQKSLEEAEEKAQQQSQQQQQSQEKMQEAQLQANAQEKQDDRAFRAEESRLERENKIQVASLKSMSFDTDVQDNSIIDAAKQADIYLAQTVANNTLMDKQMDRATKVGENDKDRALKYHELNVKKQIEDKKATVALKNKVVGEK
jgi:hypothetical protein